MFRSLRRLLDHHTAPHPRNNFKYKSIRPRSSRSLRAMSTRQSANYRAGGEGVAGSGLPVRSRRSRGARRVAAAASVWGGAIDYLHEPRRRPASAKRNTRKLVVTTVSRPSVRKQRLRHSRIHDVAGLRYQRPPSRLLPINDHNGIWVIVTPPRQIVATVPRRTRIIGVHKPDFMVSPVKPDLPVVMPR